MRAILLRIPDELLTLIDTQGKSLNAEICKAIAAHVKADYTPPTRGGRRVPRNLTAAEISRAQVTPEQAPITPKKATFHGGAQRATPLEPNTTLAGQGYAWAEIFKANNRYTGKLLTFRPDYPRDGCRYENVGSMTLAEFEKACGRQAIFDD